MSTRLAEGSSSLPKRFMSKAANLLNVSSPSDAAGESNYLSPNSSSPLQRRKSDAGAQVTASLKQLKDRALSTSKSITRKGRNARAKSDSGSTRPVMHRHAHSASMSDGRNQSFRHEDYPRTPERSESPSVPGNAPDEDEIKVPVLLQQGTLMLKVSPKKTKKHVFHLDAELGQITWESKKPKRIPIETIKEIRSGEETRYYREQLKVSSTHEEHWITIIYILDGKYKTLHIVPYTRDIFVMWNTTLRKLYALRQELMGGLGNMERRQLVWEKQYWKGSDQSGDQKLSFEEVEMMCKRLNIKAPQSDLLNAFMEADSRSRGHLDFNDFRRFVKLLKSRPEVTQLYNSVRGNSEFTIEVFGRFMLQDQMVDLSQDEIARLFQKFLPRKKDGQLSVPPSPSHKNEPLNPTDGSPAPAPNPVQTPSTEPTSQNWSLESFTSFLLSAENSPFVDHSTKIWHDMDRPLSEYFISSSHNTYLVGHQLVGDATVEGYIRALLHGCRSVELDIWDGDDEPAIYHGRTLTSPVSLTDVARAIEKYAFVASPYPVIISAEIHCSLKQQEMVADIMKKVFGDALVTAPIDNEERIEALPSPERLKHRILLKAKNLYVAQTGEVQSYTVPIDTESSSTDTTSSSDAEPIKELKQEFHGFLNRVRGKKPERHTQTTVNIPDAPPGSELRAPATRGVPQSPPPPGERQIIKMSMALAALLVYTVGVKCRGFNKKETYAIEHVFSLSERTANKILKQSMVDLVKHNRTHISRVYPNGIRLASSNYEPHRYWAAGAQLVAINWQTFDLGYMMNFAMFQRNGRCGYVLKPLALRVKDKETLGKRTTHFLDVTIISAQQLPRAKDEDGHEVDIKHTVDPYVEVSLHIPDWSHSPFLPDGSAAYSAPTNSGNDSTSASSARTISYSTQVIKNNGFNPVWQKSLSLPFDVVGDMLDLVFVKFQVKDEHDDDNIAVYCVSLGSLALGYRHLPLHDQQLSQYLFSTLFVHTNIRTVE